MVDLQEVNLAIKGLENQELTFDICQKLASLYIIREYNKPTDAVIREYDDILPSYKKFCEIKRMYQLSEISEEAVYKQLELLCSEISEFLLTLYHNTDTQHEHDIIEEMLTNIKKSA